MQEQHSPIPLCHPSNPGWGGSHSTVGGSDLAAPTPHPRAGSHTGMLRVTPAPPHPPYAGDGGGIHPPTSIPLPSPESPFSHSPTLAGASCPWPLFPRSVPGLRHGVRDKGGEDSKGSPRPHRQLPTGAKGLPLPSRLPWVGGGGRSPRVGDARSPWSGCGTGEDVTGGPLGREGFVGGEGEKGPGSTRPLPTLRDRLRRSFAGLGPPRPRGAGKRDRSIPREPELDHPPGKPERYRGKRHREHPPAAEIGASPGGTGAGASPGGTKGLEHPPGQSGLEHPPGKQEPEHPPGEPRGRSIPRGKRGAGASPGEARGRNIPRGNREAGASPG